jgi:hypothetical protein
MNTNQHDALRDDLKAYLDNELNPWRRAAVRRHLANCQSCRMEVKDMETISQQLHAADEQATLDPALRSRLLGRAPATNVSATPEIDRTFETAPAPARRRPWLKDLVFVGGIASLLLIATLNTMGKKVQTVFNVANNALTTDGGPSDYAASAPAAPSAGAAGEAMKPYSDSVRSEVAERYARNNVDAVRKSEPAFQAGGSGSLGASAEIQRRVHKEASIGVVVQSAETAGDAVVKLVQGAGGFIAGNSLTTGADNAKNASIEVRVPVGQFENVLRDIGKLGDVKSKNISGRDITEQFSDADQERRILTNDLSIKEAQLRAAKERAAKKKKTYVPDWQERAELRTLRIQAAQARARLELLRKTTDWSKISVQLMESATPPGEAGFWQSIGKTKNDAAQSFLAAARLPIACLIWILAYSPLWLPALLIWRYFNRTPKSAA